MDYLTSREALDIVLRNLTDIAIRMPRKESEKVLKIIDQIYTLTKVPFMTYNKEDYPENLD